MRVLTLISLMIMVACSSLNGQARLRTDKTQALIGDHLLLKLTVPGIKAGDWLNADVLPADTIESVEVIEEGDLTEQAGGGIQKSWRIAVFDTGLVRIPAMQLELRRDGEVSIEYTNDIPLVISGVIDSSGLAPIKPIVYEPARISDYLPYILAGIGLIGLIVGIVYLRNRPAREITTAEIMDTRRPHELALESLHALEEKRLWQKGFVKEFHSELSHILRMYVEARYDVPALESTTTELRERLKPVIDEGHYREMMQMMSIEDLIKFAKAEPAPEVHDKYLGFVRAFVLSTREADEKEVGDA